MKSLQSQALPLLQMLWRHRWLAVVTAWLVCTGGWIAVALMPTKYESSARVYLNADPLLTPLLRGLAADTNPARHLDFMRRTLTSRPNLEQLIHLVDFGVKNDKQKEELFKELAGTVSVSSGHREPVDHRLPQQQSGAGERCGAGAADDLCREHDRPQPQRDGQRAALSRRRDRLLPG